jgi:hypothetical protein
MNVCHSCAPPSRWNEMRVCRAKIAPSMPAHPAVCRDSSGTVIKGISVINSSCDPTYGEALAAPLASSLSASLKLASFTLEGDFQVVISALQQPSFVQVRKIVDRILLQNRFLYFLLPPLG